MSEYQYYEFQAVDRALTRTQQERLTEYSTRAEITSTRFVNHYEWGDFRGDVDAWIAKYFDAFVYIANWGTRDLRFRFPRELLDVKVAKAYCTHSGVTIRSAGKHVVLAFWSEDESGDRWDDDGRGWMPALIPLRADVAAGDHRALYLGWLRGACDGGLDEDVLEPPVPPGLSTLTAPLESLVEFLGLDEDVLARAARNSPRGRETSSKALERWIASLPERDKTRLLAAVASDGGPQVRAELWSRYRQTLPRPRAGSKRRTVGDLIA